MCVVTGIHFIGVEYLVVECDVQVARVCMHVWVCACVGVGVRACVGMGVSVTVGTRVRMTPSILHLQIQSMDVLAFNKV